MLVEIAGCSGSGKTTLSIKALQNLRSRGFDVVYSPEEVARATHTMWIESDTIRNVVLNVLLLPWFFQSIWRHPRFFKFAIPITYRTGRGLTERVSRFRSLMRLMAAQEMLRAKRYRKKLLLVDEGTIGCVHNVFVSPDFPPNLEQVRQYANLVPAPDLIVHTEVALSVALERTRIRPDPPSRLRGHQGNRPRCAAFLAHGQAVFSELVSAEPLRTRVIAVDNGLTTPRIAKHSVEEIVDFVLRHYRHEAVSDAG